MKRWTPSAAIVVALIAGGPSAWSQANLALAEAPADQVGMSKQKLDRIHNAFKEEVDQSKLAGTVELVARKGKLVYADAVDPADRARDGGRSPRPSSDHPRARQGLR